MDDLVPFGTGDPDRMVGVVAPRSLGRSLGSGFGSSFFSSSFFSSCFSSSSDDSSDDPNMSSYSISFLTIFASFLSCLRLRGDSSSDKSEICGRSPTLALARRYCFLRFSYY